MERWGENTDIEKAVDAMYERADERTHKIFAKFLELARATIEPEADSLHESKGHTL